VARLSTATRHAPNGMVCSVDHLASSAGCRMLAAGGSAADAAVAAAAVLAVTTPYQCGMGGDLFALVHTGDGPPAALDASGHAGSGVDADGLRSEGWQQMPRRKDLRSVTVPGCVDGWMALHDRFGHLPRDQVLGPALAYAREGFRADTILAAVVPFADDVEGIPEWDRPGGLAAGDHVTLPRLARALEAVIADGRRGFYEGEFGRGLVAIGNGLFSDADLARSQADWVEPLGLRVFGHDVWTTPPASQGYLTLGSAWIAEGLPLPRDPEEDAWAHLLVESARQAGHDRLDVLHDRADGGALLAPERLAPRRSAIDSERAGTLPVPGRAGGTVFLCAVDGDRMGVSLIQSNAEDFGIHVVEPGTGVFLHNRGMGFSLVPGHPAELGPGRRPPHTLAPGLVTRGDGSLRALVGTMGGDSQPQIVLQLLARLLHGGDSPGRAVSAPRWMLALAGGGSFDTWDAHGEVVVCLERGAPWAAGLERRGHRLELRPPGFGHAHVIEVGDDEVRGASDPRAENGAAIGL